MWFIIVEMYLNDTGIEIYMSWHSNLENSLYIIVDNMKEKFGRCLKSEDMAGVVINVGM